MQRALAMYEKAVGLLQTADSHHGAEVEAERLLEQAIGVLQQQQPSGHSPGHSHKKRKRQQSSADDSDIEDEEDEEEDEGNNAKALEGELHMLLGRIIEWKDPERGLAAYTSAHSAEPGRAEANLHLGRLLWKCAASEASMAAAEARLREAADIAGSDGDEEGWLDAQELLARMLLQDGRGAEAHEILRELGYTHAYATELASLRTAKPVTAKPVTAQPSPVNAFDAALPRAMLAQMRRALARDASYWRENHYNSPRTGFFSFQHSLPPFQTATKRAATGSAAPLDLDAVLQHIWVVSAQAVPAVQKARYCEWWAHSRQHCYGHQVHFDSIPGERAGEPLHPIISTISFLSAECGGPTLVTDQTIKNGEVTMGWLARPATNRLITFDGSLLHSVLPGAGAAPSADARRTTFMVAFWEENPHRPLFTDARARDDLTWPADFEQGGESTAVEDEEPKRAPESAVTHLGADEIWEDVSCSKTKKKKKKGNKKKDKPVGLNMMSPRTFFSLSEGILGLGIRANPDANTY
mmetsp:Transcript_4168/g.9437  ORF Transcript_4168/g.9437 Transcript_4168/m.9437 type:complete len:525 (+) Transcript_4168:27-1601(+)